jgi:hypothetical protein
MLAATETLPSLSPKIFNYEALARETSAPTPAPGKRDRRLSRDSIEESCETSSRLCRLA